MAGRRSEVAVVFEEVLIIFRVYRTDRQICSPGHIIVDQSVGSHPSSPNAAIGAGSETGFYQL